MDRPKMDALAFYDFADVRIPFGISNFSIQMYNIFICFMVGGKMVKWTYRDMDCVGGSIMTYSFMDLFYGARLRVTKQYKKEL